jgi:predicted exporter
LFWVAIILGLSVWVIACLDGGSVVRTDLMDLLPADDRDPAISAVVSDIQKQFERRLVVLVGAPDRAGAEQTANRVFRSLEATDRFGTLSLRHDEDSLQAMVGFYLPMRYQMLSRTAAVQLAAGDWAAFRRSVFARYFSPTGQWNSDLVRVDPMLLLAGALEDRMATARGRLQLVNGYLSVEESDTVFILIEGSLNGSPFSIDLQSALLPVFDGIRESLSDTTPGATLLVAGVLPHAIAETARARAEVSIVGTGSVIGILALFLLTFRSPKPLLLSLASIVVGIIGGFAACLLGFGGMHLITLVFGASLIGISVDYSLHFFCERFRQEQDWSSALALRRILPGITLGLVTSVIGLMALFIAPFPGMREMAVFSSVGLIFAYANVVILYPTLAARIAPPRSGRPLLWAGAYASLWQGRYRSPVLMLLAVMCGAAVIGLFRLEANDDIRMLQSPDGQVQADELNVRRIIGHDVASQFFLVAGRDDAELLMREEALTNRLRALEAEGAITGHVAISDVFPSPERQLRDRGLVAQLLGTREGEDTLREIATAIGLPEKVIEAYREEFGRLSATPAVPLGDWIASSGSGPFRQLYRGDVDGNVYTVVGLSGVSDVVALADIATALPFARFIDPPATISSLFETYRQRTGWLVLVAYALILLVLALRYGAAGAIAVMIPPVVAALLALGTVGLLGEAFTLFNILALLLVLGVGVDYGLFSREKGSCDRPTQLAIAMSCLTTILAFGLLSFSTTTAIHAFGLTVFVGTMAAWLLSPISNAWRRNERNRESV